LIIIKLISIVEINFTGIHNRLQLFIIVGLYFYIIVEQMVEMLLDFRLVVDDCFVPLFFGELTQIEKAIIPVRFV
jgi:hypothetical protein